MGKEWWRMTTDALEERRAEIIAWLAERHFPMAICKCETCEYLRQLNNELREIRAELARRKRAGGARMTKSISWTKYPIRVCRWLNECRICGRNITDGERYYDGGYGRRGHELCVLNEIADRKAGEEGE
jgi:hypothetical protein